MYDISLLLFYMCLRDCFVIARGAHSLVAIVLEVKRRSSRYISNSRVLRSSSFNQESTTRNFLLIGEPKIFLNRRFVRGYGRFTLAARRTGSGINDFTRQHE